jgi:hypothetical protein
MANSGSTDRTSVRKGLCALGVLLMLAGAGAVVAGAVVFARGSLADDMGELARSVLSGILLFGGGGLIAMAGMSAWHDGFRSRRRYVATESMSLVDDPAELLSEDDT